MWWRQLHFNYVGNKWFFLFNLNGWMETKKKIYVNWVVINDFKNQKKVTTNFSSIKG